MYRVRLLGEAINMDQVYSLLDLIQYEVLK